MHIDAEDGQEPLELHDDQVLELDEDQQEEQQEPEEQDEETVISFGDPEEGDGEEVTPLVKKLRDQVRSLQRQARTRTVSESNDDPEPVIPARPSLEAMEYDQDRFDSAYEAREQAIKDHSAWERRNDEREAARKRMADDQAKQVQQQVRALGVTDYEERARSVRDQLSDQQMAVLINATDNPAKLLYALGRSETRLEELSSIDNLAKFAARIGQLEREIKVSKRRPPAPESQVRGATGALASSAIEAKIERLEKDFSAGKLTDRTEIQALKRQLRAA